MAGLLEAVDQLGHRGGCDRQVLGQHARRDVSSRCSWQRSGSGWPACPSRSGSCSAARPARSCASTARNRPISAMMRSICASVSPSSPDLVISSPRGSLASRLKMVGEPAFHWLPASSIHADVVDQFMIRLLGGGQPNPPFGVGGPPRRLRPRGQTRAQSHRRGAGHAWDNGKDDFPIETPETVPAETAPSAQDVAERRAAQAKAQAAQQMRISNPAPRPKAARRYARLPKAGSRR